MTHRASSMFQVFPFKVASIALSGGLILALSSFPAAASDGSPASDSPGVDDYVGGDWDRLGEREVARHLSADESEVSHPLALAGRAESVEFVFGEETFVVDPSTTFEVYRGVSTSGEEVWRVGALTSDRQTLASSGFAVPPSSYWKYHSSGSGTTTVDTWKRSWWWNVNKANNYTANSKTRDYYRVYARLQAAVLTDKVNSSNPNLSGFDQAWIEMDRSGTWPSTTAKSEFETPQPTDSVDGKSNQTITVGFKQGVSVTLGRAPVSVSGSLESSYSGTLSSSIESWHPVQRAEVGSGGVMWCYYKVDPKTKKAVEFNGTRSIAARSSIDIGSTGTPGKWAILTGQRDRAHGTSCPAQ